MYIRRTKTKSLDQGEGYYTYRIVESVRIGQQVKQRTLLNLGKDFAVDPAHWPYLTDRIAAHLQGMRLSQRELPGGEPALEPSLAQELEQAAEHYSALIATRLSQPVADEAIEADYQRIDISQVEASHARSIGAETLGLHAVRQLQLDQKLTALGFNGIEVAAVLGSLIGRMVSPGSERHTHAWLQNQSALSELLAVDFNQISLTRLYTVSDKLFKHRAELEAFLGQREQTLFNLSRSIVLYDLTNTYFEGRCATNPEAQFGRSKEKRSDCQLVTLGLVLDGEGFPLGSQVFPGNASEPATLSRMLEGLQHNHPSAATPPLIVMDAGLASEDNIAWLIEQGYHYLVVSRERKQEDPREQADALLVRETGRNRVTVYREIDPVSGETRLYCHSALKEKKEQGIRNRFHQRMEAGLMQLSAGLNKKGTIKRYDKVLERVGRLREKNTRVAQDYRIEVIADDAKHHAIRIDWQYAPDSAQKDRQCGLYCLRTNLSDWNETRLWETYLMLTEIEATFRSLKTELGLRPVYHQKKERVNAHLFISLLAYHLVHTLRYQLKEKEIHLSWESIRNIMATQQRLTLMLPTDSNTTILLRTTTRPEALHQQLYQALNIKPDPIGKRKTIIDRKKSVVPTDFS
ncbi:IS1634 family transposase [Nitrosomonas sp. ANs5]|uniref:IS1634 family transposase n=1 Tax=Nitrosomonas sp. ANs5 TaxID=3423941 RepID=UPI003D32625B